MTQLTDRITAMPLPDGAGEIYYDGLNSIGFDMNGALRFIHFPPGSYRFLFTTKSATEEDARKVVACNQDFVRGAKVQMAFYENYEGQYSSFPSALASLESLLRSKGLDEKNNFALIEKM